MTKPIESIPNQILQKTIDKIDSQVAREQDHRSSLVEKLGEMGVASALRAALIAETSVDLGESPVTDSFQPKGEPETESTVLERNIGERAIRALSERKSIHGPNGPIIAEGGRNRPNNQALTLWQRRRDVQHAKRLAKQDLRRARSAQMERIFGGGIGLGRTARYQTAVERARLQSEAKGKYKSGEISAQELLKEKSKIKNKRVVVATKAVRRAHRRERRGAFYTHAKAAQPVVKKVDNIRTKLLTRRAQKITSKVERSNTERQKLQAELDRRNRLETNS